MTTDAHSQGLALMGENRFAEAETCFAGLLGDARDDAILRLYFLSLLYQDKYRTVVEHMNDTTDSTQSSRVLHDLMMRSILANQWNFIEGLFEAAADDAPLANAIASFWMGCLAHLRNHMQDIDDLFKQAYLQVRACADLPMDESFRESALAGRNISLQEFWDIAQQDKMPVANSTDVACPEGGVSNDHDFVFFMSSDGVYFDAYGEDALKAIAAAGDSYACHLHLIGADDAVLERARKLAERTPGVILSITSEPVPDRDVATNLHTYYACNRFVQAAHVMKHHDKDVLIIDIDDFVKDNIGDLVGAAEDHDVCFFQNVSPSPMVVCSAAAVYVANNPRGRLFLRSMSSYISKRLAEGGRWMLDQAALYCALKLLGQAKNSVRFGNFSDLLSSGLRDYLTPTDNIDAKSHRNAGRFG
ncbi:MAG: hypothetical protein ACTSV1_09145 [Alphaproteobacteria bacterium]